MLFSFLSISFKKFLLPVSTQIGRGAERRSCVLDEFGLVGAGCVDGGRLPRGLLAAATQSPVAATEQATEDAHSELESNSSQYVVHVRIQGSMEACVRVFGCSGVQAFQHARLGGCSQNSNARATNVVRADLAAEDSVHLDSHLDGIDELTLGG